MTRHFAIPFALAAAACAQSLAGPERAAEIRQAFDRPPGAVSLRCDISPVKPALDFDFRFHTGYRLSIPLQQLSGVAHELTVHVRVTPDGKPPVFLTTTKRLPEVPDLKADAVADGMYVVGEGSYSVDLVVLDDQKRSCRSSWQMQARRNGGERQLAATTPPLAVAETESANSEQPAKAPDIARLSILLHAAPMTARRVKLEADDVATLISSLASLLRQWPARSVRLAAFNLDQRSVVLRSDKFDLSQIEDLRSKLDHLDLGTVDYKTVAKAGKPIDLFSGILDEELNSPQKPDALLIVGPRTIDQERDPVQLPEKRAETVPIFYLQYPLTANRLSFLPLGARVQQGDPQIISQFPERPGRGGVMAPPIAVNVAMADGIQKWIGRLKGETIAIYSPHDLAEAIHRIDPRIQRSAPPPQVAPPAEVTPAKITPPELPPAAKTPEPEKSAESDADPIDVLALLRDRVLDRGRQIPNHTCVETVARSRFEHTGQPASSCDAVIASRRKMGAADRLRLATTDRLRLDVALSPEREIYSWAGDNKFDDRDIDEIVPHGAMGTGPFASFLLSVFQGRPPRFVFEGDTRIKDHAVYEYSFAVPREESHFRFKTGKEWVVIAYSGRLFVDPRNSDLIRLVVRTEELPPETQTCEVETTLDYGKVRLSGGLFFLPATTDQIFVGRNGDEHDNVYTFASCRDFRAESSVHFGAQSGEASARTEDADAALQWPGGLPVVIEVTDAIDSDTAAAGDRIHGRLAQPIRDVKGNALVPAGVSLAGRLMRVEVRHPSPQVTIALRWETIELGGKTLPVHLAPNRLTKPGTGVQLGGIASLAGLKRRGVEFELPLPGEERFMVYHFSGKRALVQSGMKTEWVTVKP